MKPKQEVARIQLELEGIVWEAREGGFFSIDDIEEIAKELKDINWSEGKDKKEPSWFLGFGAWFAIPFMVCLIPFAYLYSFLFQRR